MARVYTELRRRIMEGDLRPGARLDPAGIGKEMHASITPIRDALHQLKGEGLVESWKHEGFWIADLSEPVIRDRYLWCRDLVSLCIRAAATRPMPVARAEGESYADAVTHLLHCIAALSTNQEHWRAMTNVCDRTYTVRRVEAQVLNDPMGDVVAVRGFVDRRLWSDALVAYEAFHIRRMEIVPQLAVEIRTG